MLVLAGLATESCTKDKNEISGAYVRDLIISRTDGSEYDGRVSSLFELVNYVCTLSNDLEDNDLREPQELSSCKALKELHISR